MDGRALATTRARGIKRMEQQVSTSYSVRPRKDAKRQFGNGKVQAHSGPPSGGSIPEQKAVSWRARITLEDDAYEYRPQDGETPKVYYMRCPELGVHDWERTAGPNSMFAAIKMKLFRCDHDEAFPVSLGGKDVAFEVRHEGSTKVMRFVVKGSFAPRYSVERVN